MKYKTVWTKKEEIERKWYIVDVKDQILGRVATKIASLLIGKEKPEIVPDVDCGDYVIVINADKIVVTGNKLDTKFYYNHSQYPGGLRTRSMRTMKNRYTVEWVEKSIHGMLPHTKLGNVQRKHLFVYKGSEHPHAAQKPVELKIEE